MAEYKISTITDILELKPEQRERCIEDLKAWLRFSDAVIAEDMGLKPENYFVWVDDERVGKISGVRIFT